jgi:hypothetical protein
MLRVILTNDLLLTKTIITMNINKNIAVSDSGFVFNPTTGESYSVNPIGVEIIELLKQEKTFDEITQNLTQRYNADIVTLDKDVSDFISLLKQYSLIENQNAA